MHPPHPDPSESQLLATGHFEKGRDGRYVLESGHKHCVCAAGLAQSAGPHGGDAEAILKGCQLCGNWSPRVGCVLGYNLYLEETAASRSPLEVAMEQARAWEEACQLERAVARLDRYLKAHPEDAWAYLLLARLYERPAYRGPDRRRSVVLYDRYIELRGAVLHDDPDLALAKARRAFLIKNPPAPAGGEALAESEQPLTNFTAFYHFGALTHVVYGILTRELFIFVKVGDVDPVSGKRSLEMGQQYERATRVIRWLGGEESEQLRELELTQREIESLEGLAPLRLRMLNLKGAWDFHLNVRQVECRQDLKRECTTLLITTQQAKHPLLFPASQARKAHQCRILLDHLAQAYRKQDSEKKL